MKAFKTKAGVRRHLKDLGHKYPVLRILSHDNAEELFIVIDSVRATVHTLDPETFKSVGRISAASLTAQHGV